MTYYIRCLCGNVMRVVTDSFGVFYCSHCKTYREISEVRNV